MFLKSLLGLSAVLAAATDCSEIAVESCRDYAPECVPFGSHCVDSPNMWETSDYMNCYDSTSEEDCEGKYDCEIIDGMCIYSRFYCPMGGYETLCEDDENTCVKMGSKCYANESPHLFDANKECSYTSLRDCGNGDGCMVHDDTCVGAAYYCELDGCDGRDNCIPFGSECIDDPFPLYYDSFLECHYTSLDDCEGNGCIIHDDTCVDVGYYCKLDGCDGRDNCIPYGSECIDDPFPEFKDDYIAFYYSSDQYCNNNGGIRHQGKCIDLAYYCELTGCDGRGNCIPYGSECIDDPFPNMHNKFMDCHFSSVASCGTSQDNYACVLYKDSCIDMHHFCEWDDCELGIRISSSFVIEPNQQNRSKHEKLDYVEYRRISVSYKNEALWDHDGNETCRVENNDPGSSYGITSNGYWYVGSQSFGKLGTNRMGVWILGEGNEVAIQPKKKKAEYWEYTMPKFSTTRYYLSYVYVKSSKLEKDLVNQRSNYSSVAYITCEDDYGNMDRRAIKTVADDSFGFDFDWY